MKRDDVIRMAEQCGIPEFENNESQADNIMRFAALVAAAERESICKLGEDSRYSHQYVHSFLNTIRARGQA